MKVANSKEQKRFFDLSKNQYQIQNILFFPKHTELELKEIVKRLKNIDKKEWIVDFGAGTGRVTKKLIEENFSVLSVDISTVSLLKLKNSLKLPVNRFKMAKVIPNSLYSAIVGADILHHIDMDEYFPIFYSHLKKKGKIIFSEPCALNIAWYIYLSVFYDWNVEKGIMNCTYTNLFNKLKKHGFSRIKITGFGFFPTPFFKWSEKFCRFNAYLGSLPILKYFAYRFIIEASKE